MSSIRAIRSSRVVTAKPGDCSTTPEQLSTELSAAHEVHCEFIVLRLLASLASSCLKSRSDRQQQKYKCAEITILSEKERRLRRGAHPAVLPARSIFPAFVAPGKKFVQKAVAPALTFWMASSTSLSGSDRIHGAQLTLETSFCAVDLAIWISRHLFHPVEHGRQHVLWQRRRELFANESRRKLLVALVEQRDFLFVLIIDHATIANARPLAARHVQSHRVRFGNPGA